MASVGFTRLIVAEVSDPAAIEGIKERFLPLPTTCKKNGELYVQDVKIRQTLAKDATQKPDYNLVIELDFRNEEDFKYFATADEVHLAAVAWAKPRIDSMLRLSLKA